MNIIGKKRACPRARIHIEIGHGLCEGEHVEGEEVVRPVDALVGEAGYLEAEVVG